MPYIGCQQEALLWEVPPGEVTLVRLLCAWYIKSHRHVIYDIGGRKFAVRSYAVAALAASQVTSSEKLIFLLECHPLRAR